MSRLFRSLQGVILSGVVCALTFTASPDRASAQGVSPAAALAGAAGGTKEGRTVLQQYFAQFSGRSEELEKRTNDLIKALSTSAIAADPIALQDAVTSIAQAARQAIFSKPIAGVKMPSNFRLSPRSFGFDFGAPDSNVMPNFQHVTAKDKRLSGGDRRAMRRPSSDQLLSDGIVNVRKFATDMPNGKWRVVLFTDNLNTGKALTNPLGQKISVNGNSMPIAQTGPSGWLKSSTLSGSARKSGGGRGDGATSGPASVGRAQKIVAAVRGESPTKTRYLVLADKVFSNEKISTDASSAARLVFLDNSIISIGANSTVTLDKFVFDSAGTKSEVALSLSKGVMRFVSGDLPKDRYSIRTPTATMGIRGTILEITVAANGTTTTAVVDGEATVSSAGKRTTVKKGFSTTTSRGRPPTPPRAIIPSPPSVSGLKTALGPDPDVKEEAAQADAQSPPSAPIAPDPNQQANADDAGTGGMVIIEAEVVDGKLVIDLDALAGDSTYVTAIIVEPTDEKSNLDLSKEVEEQYQNDSERLAATVNGGAKLDQQGGVKVVHFG
ncbi:MAG: FecR domain-containing protein [Proteobacteria bacterium]|nr:FecR domain-containing protein [Pseudomonadota bacterium]